MALKVWPKELLKAGAKFVFLPVCAYCKRQAPSCLCGRPNRRPM